LGRIDITTQNKDWRSLLPGVLISLIALAIIFYFIDLREVATAIRAANYALVALALGVTFAWLAIRGIVWRTLLQEKATFSQVFLTLNEGYLMNNLLPFRLGEVGRAFLLGEKAGIGFWPVFSTILIERALDVAFAAGLLLSSLPFVVGVDWARQAALISGALVVAGFVLLYLLARSPDKAMVLFERTAGRLRVFNRLGSRFQSFLGGLSILTNTSRFLRALGWMAVNLAVAVLQYYILLKAFFPQAEPLWALFVLGAAAMGLAAPSSPGSVGVLEGIMIGALAVFGVDESAAFAFALAAHLMNYLSTGIIGIYGLSREGETLAGLYRRVRRVPVSEEK
jgi:uncharacterized protein (TIRG00374 family)